MKWTEILAGELHAAEQRLRVALGDKASEVVEKINSDAAFADSVAAQIIMMAGEADKSSTSLNPQWLRAREIMGTNMFGVEEAMKHFGVNPSKAQLAALAEIPFSEAVLEQCKNTHVLVAVFPLSILDIRSKANVKKLFYDQSWYNGESFAKSRGKIGWQLVRKTPVSNSTSKNWSEQQALISQDDETPTAQVLAYTIIGHFLATGERLFERIYVRTSSVGSGGSRVPLGDFAAAGLRVYGSWDDHRDGDLAVSSARKSN
ncbi:MAG: hypothetical protein WC668_03240 [Patescibacteria group bacterium]|jgi:hypothetical protein